VKREQGGQVRIYGVGNIEPVPPELGLIFGDCLHNFRAALDNLVFAIAVDNNPNGLTRDESRACKFPIAEKRGLFRESRHKGSIAKLPVRAQATVQQLQPYKTGKHPEGEPLAILKKLSDLDKHRFVPMVAWAPQTIARVTGGSGFTPPPPVEATWLTHELVPNTDFLRLTVAPEHAEVQMEVKFLFCISLQEPAELAGRDAWYWLYDIREAIARKVYPSLAPYCTGVPPAGFGEATTDALPTLLGSYASRRARRLGALDNWVTART
jgi:hypothetical protein